MLLNRPNNLSTGPSDYHNYTWYHSHIAVLVTQHLNSLGQEGEEAPPADTGNAAAFTSLYISISHT